MNITFLKIKEEAMLFTSHL